MSQCRKSDPMSVATKKLATGNLQSEALCWWLDSSSSTLPCSTHRVVRGENDAKINTEPRKK